MNKSNILHQNEENIVLSFIQRLNGNEWNSIKHR